MAFHYGPNGEYLGSSSDFSTESTSAIGQLVLLALIVGAIFFVWDLDTHWQRLDAPYSYAGAFYYYTIALPIKSVFYVWHWINDARITSYPNLNAVISSILAFFYVGFLVALIGIIGGFIAFILRIKTEKIGPLFRSVLTLPASLSLVYWLFSSVYSWLFSETTIPFP